MYKVSLLKIFKDALLDLNEMVGPDDHVEFSWHNGSVRLTISPTNKSGGLDYRYQYHPNVVCEGENICKWCGRII